MATPLRILIVEDSEADAELLLRELRRGDYAPEFERVETPEELNAALDRQPWDLIVSDNAMPHLNGLQALRITKEKNFDIPFIIVSGSIGEDAAVAAMKAGAHDYLMKDNTARLLPAIERELREAEVRRERHQANETIHQLAYTDPVTDLPNRARFLILVKEAIATGLRNHHPAAVLIMNLDHFREINETLGHDLGDSLLKKVGIRLRSALFGPDVIARLGSDEFGILLPRLAVLDDVRFVIDKLQHFLEVPFILDEIPIIVEASFGIALMPDHANRAETLLQRADIAMHRAKAHANGYEVFTEEVDRRSPERIGLMAELRDAIDKNQLLLHFQPKVEIKSGCIVGIEALVRWQHPRLGLLPPDKFILAAEQTGLIGPLTRWVLVEALKHCKSLSLRVSVNLSARSLHDPHLLEMIEQTLTAATAEPGQLMLEVTESAIIVEPTRALEALAALNRLGVSLSIDDFGTGYTSLASIKHMPVSEIKIDKSFVLGMLTDSSDNTVVRTIIDLGHNLGMQVVAEGVETQEIYDALAALGCDEAQGYYISRPQACEALKSWLPASDWKFKAAS